MARGAGVSKTDMIICHPLRLIFVKTRKVGGTSMEIALSKYCDEHCVITPLMDDDEAIREAKGFRGPQNYEHSYWPTLGRQTVGKFYNHMPAKEVRELVPGGVWKHYRKITIYRDPFDQAVSRYYWERHRLGPEKAGADFAEFVSNKTKYLKQNRRIAPLKGSNQLDFYLRYDRLEEGLSSLGLEGIWATMQDIRAKAGIRPEAAQGLHELYRRHPETIEMIEKACGAEIEYFGFDRPSYSPSS